MPVSTKLKDGASQHCSVDNMVWKGGSPRISTDLVSTLDLPDCERLHSVSVAVPRRGQ